MNEQETFDKVVSHLRKQGKQCLAPDGISCLYRSPEGLSCAVGCLIPDDIYKQDIEGIPIEDLAERFPEVAKAISYDNNKDLLSRLQSIHDIDEPSSWEKEFADIAEEYDLTFTPK